MGKHSKKGFTLVELMVVIAIMGILATVAVPNTMGVIERARERIDVLKLFYLRDALNRALVESEYALSDSPYLSQGNANEKKAKNSKLTELLTKPSGVNIFVMELKPGQPANFQGAHAFANESSNMSQLIEHGGTWYDALKEAGFKGVADIVALRWEAEGTYTKTVTNSQGVQEEKTYKIGIDSLAKRDGKKGTIKDYDSFYAKKYGNDWRTYPKNPLFTSRELNYGKIAGLDAITSQKIGNKTNITNYRLTLNVQWTGRNPNSRSVEVALIPNGAAIMSDDNGRGSAFLTDHGVCFSTYGPIGCADYKY